MSDIPKDKKWYAVIGSWLITLAMSGTTVNFYFGKQEVAVQLERTQAELASVADNNYQLASACATEEIPIPPDAPPSLVK